jgi:hypothetical protein
MMKNLQDGLKNKVLKNMITFVENGNTFNEPGQSSRSSIRSTSNPLNKKGSSRQLSPGKKR